MLDERYLPHLSNNLWYSQLSPVYQQYLLAHAQTLQVQKDQSIFLSGDAFQWHLCGFRGRSALRLY